jgi:S1-C subfamily serine protease
MRGSIRWLGVLGLAAALAAPGFAKKDEAPPVPLPPEPISVKQRGSYAVVFEKVLFRIPAGTPLATTRLRGKVVKQSTWDGDSEESDTFDVSATDELRRLGYDAKDSGDAMFSQEGTVHARFQIAAVVHAMTLEFDVKPDRRNYSMLAEDSTGKGDMEIEFRVFDAVEKKVVSTKRVKAQGISQGRSPMPMPPTLLSGLRAVLADAAFIEPMLKGSAATKPGDAVAKLSLRRCSAASAALPSQMQNALAAVVVVAVGGSTGSGALITDDGYAVTAAHIVGKEKSALLRLKSGLELPAEVVAVDTGRDAALLKIPGRGYACLRTASAQPAVGTEIWAIGNPVELARSVTRGVVSGNQVVRERAYLQTDAAVNPGNSGGPLLDSAGAVRGIVVEKIWLPGVEGLGFAIPIGEAERVLGIEWQ